MWPWAETCDQGIGRLIPTLLSSCVFSVVQCVNNSLVLNATLCLRGSLVKNLTSQLLWRKTFPLFGISPIQKNSSQKMRSEMFLDGAL